MEVCWVTVRVQFWMQIRNRRILGATCWWNKRSTNKSEASPKKMLYFMWRLELEGQKLLIVPGLCHMSHWNTIWNETCMMSICWSTQSTILFSRDCQVFREKYSSSMAAITSFIYTTPCKCLSWVYRWRQMTQLITRGLCKHQHLIGNFSTMRQHWQR
jgi:hypothetical protein